MSTAPLSFYDEISHMSLNDDCLPYSVCEKILLSQEIELLPLLYSAFKVRENYWGREVLIHVINNVQNGLCSEDCHYCAQSKSSKAPIEKYSMKTDEEILKEAKKAYESHADRYCLVFSGKGTSKERLSRLKTIIRTIKDNYPLEVCVSPGILSQDELLELKNAGLDRLNHNINTSPEYYEKICTTHHFEDRLKTLESAAEVGLDICSGFIAGMGEEAKDIINLAMKYRDLKQVKSIPVNFFIPIGGLHLKDPELLNPEYCLKVLCLMRFLNPQAEIRIAAGREYHLRQMQVMSLYPANSLFLSGYLNTKGQKTDDVFQMIRDAGFFIKHDVDSNNQKTDLLMKEKEDLRPFCKK